MPSNSLIVPDTHSANSIFHFVKEQRFLFSAIQHKRLSPRYCKEDIEYLGLKNQGEVIKSVAILEKCFCDIKLHSIMQPLAVKRINGESFDDCKLSHPEFYGGFGIAFSKKWAIHHNLQPLHYINAESDEVESFQKAFEFATVQDDLDDVLVDNILYRLCYLKPLSGKMPRREESQLVEYIKNFHDEREWRYIPTLKALKEVRKERVIFKELTPMEVDSINDQLENDEYETIALKFDYSDIVYILVPDYEARDNLIREIGKISGMSSFEREKLISKLLVLCDLEKDS